MVENITFEQAKQAAETIRLYINGTKVCKHYIGKEADEIFDCSYILQEWRQGRLVSDKDENGNFLGFHYEDQHDDFPEEYEWAHSVSTHNYHMEEASCGML